ncbi:MAG: His/Gly/Thr/Pro-type tRNA ligase C-terminal domain-containing protein, partial [Terracidiphilus sp.]
SCPVCGYAANLEKAVSRLEPVTELDPTGDGKPELIHTPGMGAIADIAAFLKMSPANDIKCVAYMADLGGELRPLAVFLRGDHAVNETKLLGIVGAIGLRPMQPDELEKFLKAPAGFLGPIGLNNVLSYEDFKLTWLSIPEATNRQILGEIGKPGKASGINPQHGEDWIDVVDRVKNGVAVIVDTALEGRKNMVCGANKQDYHLRNVTPGRDFGWTLLADIRSVNEGEGCPTINKDGTNCEGKLVVGKAVEVGHIFKLGYKYSESMGARVLDPNGKEVTPIMGSYGIGIERILTAAIEQSNDANGFSLPASIAPFTVVVTVTNASDAALRETGETIATELEAAGLDVLLDDRDERAGVKFKDADLIGIPYRINVGKKAASGQVELVERAKASSTDVAIDEVVTHVKQRVEEERLLASSS